MSYMVTFCSDKLSPLHMHTPSARGHIFTRIPTTPVSWHAVGAQYISQDSFLHEKNGMDLNIFI